jgi:Na+/H+ antiporter NhaC
MINMLLPIATMVLMMPIMLAYTGWGSSENFHELSNGSKIITAIGGGSGSTSVLIAVLSAIAVGIILYSFQRMFSLAETVDLMFKGISGLMPLALLMLFAFALSALCKELGTGIYVAETAKAWLSPSLVPFLVFIVSAFIAFSTGTSWGTFAIMIPIAVPMAQSMDAPLMLSVAAALGGGVFGDHSSPISDTTILSSMAAATDHIDHVRTQLPYALLAGSVSALIYLVLGFVL